MYVCTRNQIIDLSLISSSQLLEEFIVLNLKMTNIEENEILQIKYANFQVFFPIPFVEFHPTIAGMDMDEKEAGQVNPVERRDAALAMLRDGAPAKRKRPLIVQKVRLF